MSIIQMTYLSYIFYLMAGMLAALAAILFFAFDIHHIWKALQGKCCYGIKKGKNRAGALLDKISEPVPATEKLKIPETYPLMSPANVSETFPFMRQTGSLATTSETIALVEEDCTELAGTMLLEYGAISLIQNIVYINSDETIILCNSSDRDLHVNANPVRKCDGE